ncbi:Solute carrier family 43 member 3-like protein, partial [Leptotrombidium deliense]
RSYLVFPAVTFLCLGGIPLRIANMQFANLYPKHRSSIIALYSGAFSASAITFVLLKYLFENGVTFFWTNSILVFFTFLMTLFTFTLLPKDKVREESLSESNEQLTFTRNGHSCRTLQQLSPVTLEKFTFVTSSFRKASVQPKTNLVLSARNSQSTIESTPKELPLKYSLLSLPYMLHQWWYSWLITYLIMYVGSMNLWLQRITSDTSKADHLVKIYGALQVLALLIAPIAGFIMDREVNRADSEPNPELRWLKKIKSGFWPMIFTTSCVAAILIVRFFDDEKAVYASIVFITLFRSFLVAVSSAFLRIRFPAEHFNRLLGILSTVGACVTLIQFPLFVLEANSTQNAFWVNVFNCFCTLIAYLNPLHLSITSLQIYFMKKEKKQWLMAQ